MALRQGVKLWSRRGDAVVSPLFVVDMVGDGFHGVYEVGNEVAARGVGGVSTELTGFGDSRV